MTDDWSNLLKDDLVRLSEAVVAKINTTTELKDGERREVAILFLDLKGFTALSETLDHEVVHEIVNGIMKVLARIVVGHGGYVDKIEGDLIMALFGATQATENDSIRAVSCGLKMLETLAEIESMMASRGISIGARIGINKGIVTVAPDASNHLTAIGDVVNLASRMESTAEVNSIQVTSTVRSSCDDLFSWEDLGKITVKGKREPVQVYRPTGPGSGMKARWERAERVARSPLVGRKKEIDKLRDYWQLTLAESPKNRRGGVKHILVGIKGEAGIGKSRLIHEFIGELDKSHPPLHSKRGIQGGVTVLKGQTLSYAQPPFWLWTTMLRNYFDIPTGNIDRLEKLTDGIRKTTEDFPDSSTSKTLIDSTPFLAELLSIPHDDPRLKNLDDRTKHQETLIALRNLLRALGDSHAPVIVVLEDLHWIDSASRESFEFVFGNCDIGKPLLVLCLFRPDEQVGIPVQESLSEDYVITGEIELGSINPESSRGLIGHMLAPAGTSKVVEELILNHSQGNPFFIEEMVLEMIESGALTETDNEWRFNGNPATLSIPANLSSLVRSRMDRLNLFQKQGLQRASVIGMEFMLKVYRRVAERLVLEDHHEQTLSSLEIRDFLHRRGLESETSYLFKHIITHNAAYETILHHNRAILHRLTAESIEELYPDEHESLSGIIANHWDRAGDREKTIEWGMKALKYCEKTNQNDEGLRWVDRLIERIEDEQESLERDEKILDILKEKQFIQSLVCDVIGSRHSIERIAELANRWSLKKWQAFVEEQYGHRLVFEDFDVAIAHLEKAATIYRELDDRKSEIVVYHRLSTYYKLHGLKYDAESNIKKALNIAREIGDREKEITALTGLGNFYATNKQLDEALDVLLDALSKSREIKDAKCVSIALLALGNLYSDLNQPEKAFTCFQQSLDIRHEKGRKMSEALAWRDLAHSLREYGKFDEAERSYLEALRLFRETGWKRQEGPLLVQIGFLFLGKMELERSAYYLENGVELSKEYKDYILLTWINVGFGLLHILNNKKDDAIERYHKALELIEKKVIARLVIDKDFTKLRNKLLEAGLPESDLPLPSHWEKE